MAERKNAKSQMTTVRIPHEVMEAMEAIKHDGESNAGFIVTAMRGEIARRHMDGTTEDAIVSAIKTIANIRKIAANARNDLDNLINMADKEIG
ncbi:Uncharacterised protein [Yersinia intermedia]|uniref:YlcI/YnfO family protein n=1 Tax=Yersinia intermedia TaxID=631 RepID=UPI0005DF1451|nr:YlcI/YnfO family protein [Yersinia intermedia]CNH15471.1 Uncharacterised protein [Yersinia intermedia]CQD77894.1 Uncharacterised protein [Yersinia intermedia]